MGECLTVADLFQEAPERWGLRGDPHLWNEMRQYFADVECPASTEELAALIEKAFEELSGVSISTPDCFYVQKYSHGGMSSGYLFPEFWRGTAIPLLQERLLALRPEK